MKVSHLIAVLLVAVLAGSLCAQTVIYTGEVGFSGSSSHKHVVQDNQGTLWSLSVGDNPPAVERPLFLHSSTDGGMTWNLDPFVFNDATSGLSGTNPANGCALAIDDQGTLHATWARYYYPSNFYQYYRSYNPGTGIASNIVNISTTFTAAPTDRSTALDIAVDGGNVVWIVAQATSSWVDRLIYSDVPYAAPSAPGVDPTFTMVGTISTTSSAQNANIAVDNQGRVHCVYYRATSPGHIVHRFYDPATSSWGPFTILGNSTPTNDYLGKVCADANGFVHCLYGMDQGSTDTWKYRYRIWDPANLATVSNGWGAEEFLFDVTPAQHTPTPPGTALVNRYIVALGCNEMTSKAWVVYRDMANGGGLRLQERDPIAGTWSNLPDLTPGALGAHEYYRPSIRGALYPAFNNTGTDLDITYRNGVSPGPYSLIFHRLSFGGPQVTLSLGAPPINGTLVPILISSPADASMPFICGFAAGDTPGIVLPDMRVIPLNIDALLDFSLLLGNGIFSGNIGTLDGSGGATAQLLIPAAPWLAGLSIYGAFVIPDPMAAYGVGTISPGLTVTFQ